MRPDVITCACGNTRAVKPGAGCPPKFCEACAAARAKGRGSAHTGRSREDIAEAKRARVAHLRARLDALGTMAAVAREEGISRARVSALLAEEER